MTTALTQRQLTDADAAAYVALSTAICDADESDHRAGAGAFRYRLRNPLNVPDIDAFQGVFDGDRLVAMAWLLRREVAEGQHWMSADGGVHPDYRGRGIGTQLLNWQLEVAPRIHERYFPELDLEISARLSGTNTGAHELFAHAGFAPIRWSLSMCRPADAPEPDVKLPSGLELEVCTPDVAEELRVVQNEVFRDHWRGIDWSPEAWRAWFTQDKIRLDLSFLLRDPADGAVAAFVICSSDASGTNPAGPRDLHLNIVGTHRAYRGRGLASVLIGHTVRKARERGFATQSLNVDADNPTGALGVYERAGFAVAHRTAIYSRELGR